MSATEASDKIEKETPRSEQNVNLNILADELFASGDYDKCLETLLQLECSGGNNIKLRHNKAVASFYKTQCKEHEELLLALNELDAVKNDKVRATLLVAWTSPVAKYNRAVIFYHRHMHQTAIEALQPLMDKFDTLEDSTAAIAGMLMLKLVICTNQLNKAKAFLELLMQRLGINSQMLRSEEQPPAAPENLSSLEGFMRDFKLLALLTQVLNRKNVVVPEERSPEFSALKAHQFYIMNDFQMAAKQLQRITIDNDESSLTNEINTIIANNMGVIHLRVRHYAIAAKFFQNALTFDKHIAANLRHVDLHQMSTAHSHEILYNLGISMLYLRSPKAAFQCFLVPLKSYYSNPRIWLRISEACIMEYEQKRLQMEREQLFSAMRPSINLRSSSSQSAAVPEPTLEFAALSLRNALELTNCYVRNLHMPKDDDNVEVSPRNWSSAKDNNICNPSYPITKEAVDKMLAAILAAYSYVSLRLGDYVTALEMAQQLLKQEKLSDAHKMLAHMYAGEAYIMMEKLPEARPHLEPTFVANMNEFDFETQDWQLKSLDAAQNVVRYNLAVALALQADYDNALTVLNTCNHAIVALKCKSLKLYINMRSGKTI